MPHSESAVSTGTVKNPSPDCNLFIPPLDRADGEPGINGLTCCEAMRRLDAQAGLITPFWREREALLRAALQAGDYAVFGHGRRLGRRVRIASPWRPTTEFYLALNTAKDGIDRYDDVRFYRYPADPQPHKKAKRPAKTPGRPLKCDPVALQEVSNLVDNGADFFAACKEVARKRFPAAKDSAERKALRLSLRRNHDKNPRRSRQN